MNKRKADAVGDVDLGRIAKLQRTEASAQTVNPSSFDVNVIIYKPEFGNYHHWALQLYDTDGDESTLLEVQGEHPNFEIACYKYLPEDTGLNVLQSIHLSKMELSDVQYDSIVSNMVPVRNDVTEWNCQDFVLEVIDMWMDSDGLDALDQNMRSVRELLQNMYGPMDLVQKRVLAYPQEPESGDDEDEVEAEDDSSDEDHRPDVIRSAAAVEDSDDEGSPCGIEKASSVSIIKPATTEKPDSQ